MSLIPQSWSVPGVAEEDYRVDYVKALLFWNRKPSGDSVLIRYRVFPFSFHQPLQRFRYDSVVNNVYVKPFVFNDGRERGNRGAFDFGNLRAEGSFGRQLSFGNSQDAVLNSTLNLQLSGMLGDSIELQAAITDNNIPIQPDGNTQQLNEFDQVFLQFRKKGWQLNLGDIDLRQNQSYFLSFYKRLQGIAFQTTNKVGKNGESRTLVSGSVAKGKFTRNLLEPQEGNQGPYRLRGANNEFFFIVLANTERVFYDGQLLQRGEDQDYVINYNTAEISFTPRRMITKDSRIQVEFEYADRNFLNANLYVSQELETGPRLKFRLAAFNNSDARNSPINQTLDDRQKQFLSALGDSVQRALYPNAVLDSFAAGKILYEKVYVGTDSFYRYSTNASIPLYSLSFVDVQPGNGDYVPDFNGANGKVYRYVPPVGGVRQGRYEPAIILVAPRKQQLITMGADYKAGEKTLIRADVALSNNDVNTFSTKDNGDDLGLAAKLQVQQTRMLRPGRGLEMSTQLDYEYVQRKFRPLERLRSVEFSRDWGLALQTVPLPVDENILRAGLGLKDKQQHQFNYLFTHYRRSDDYTGWQQSLNHGGNWKGWQFNNSLVLTKFTSGASRGSFWRPVVDISKQLKKLANWRMGFNYSLEYNNKRDRTTDTLDPLAFYFDIYSAYLKSDENRKNKYRLTFFTRSDKYQRGKDFIRGDRSLNLNLQTELLSNARRQLYINTTFRKLNVIDATVSRQAEDETILGRVEYVMNEWKGLLAGNVLYELGAGQEQRRDFAYLEVPAGTGQFAWNDYNNDGVQQLNEFELAAFPDQAKFIRIFTPTNDFIKANYITFNYSITLNPRAVLTQPDLKGWKKWAARFLLISSLQTNKKSLASGYFAFNPFQLGVNDTALITLGTTFLNTLAYNRYHPKWGLDLTNLRNTGKSLLTYGYETRQLNDWQLKLRWNMTRSVSLLVNGKLGTNRLLTPQFANRNFDLDVYSAEPVLTLVSGTTFRIVGGYKLDIRKNKPVFGGEESVNHSVNIESKYNILQSSSLTGKFTVSNIRYDFPANTTVSYIMLDGLLPGRNFLWSATLTKRLLNNLELNFQYDGRKAGQARTVHLGRAAITALF